MNQAQFEEKYESTLNAIEEVLEALIEVDEIELDYETVNNILNIEYEDGSEAIITKQGATQQLWLAAVSGGFHYEFNEEQNQWESTIDQLSLADKLNTVCLLQGNVTIRFPKL